MLSNCQSCITKDQAFPIVGFWKEDRRLLETYHSTLRDTNLA
jgi:hypothetical protein